MEKYAIIEIEVSFMLKLYLDNCCYNRPFDDLKQEKINLEASAVENILKKHIDGELQIYKSRAIDYEISRISSKDKKRQVEDLYDGLDLENIPYQYTLDNRVKELENFHIHYMDAYHIAYAESKKINYFLTVDKQLINASKKLNLEIKVINPIEFIMEVM